MSGGQSRGPKQFSPYRHAHTDQDLMHAAAHNRSEQPHSNGSPTKRSQRDSESTPMPSRTHSPALDLDDGERAVVRSVLDRGSKTPRTSYAATSVLELSQVAHYHDMDLCILLHELEDPTSHETVKRAVRKEVKSRIKKLGMRNDTKV